MRIGFVIERKNYYRLFGPIIERALARGWQVDCWHDLSQLRSGPKGLEFPDPGAVPSFRHGQPTVRPYRGEAFTETFDVKIPDDQPPGSAYILVGSGSMLNQVDFMLVPPDPRTLEQVIGVLARLRPSTDLTLGMYSSSEGAVTAGVYLPNLPPTMRAVVSNDTSNGAQAPVRYHPTAHLARSLGYIVDGVLKIDLDVKPAI